MWKNYLLPYIIFAIKRHSFTKLREPAKIINSSSLFLCDLLYYIFIIKKTLLGIALGRPSLTSDPC